MNEWIQYNAFFMNEWMNTMQYLRMNTMHYLWMNTIQYNAFFMNELIQYNMNELINEMTKKFLLNIYFFLMKEYNTI